MRDEETTLDPDLEWGEGMSGRVDGPVWTRPAGLGGRALAAGRDQSLLSFFLLPWPIRRGRRGTPPRWPFYPR